MSPTMTVSVSPASRGMLSLAFCVADVQHGTCLQGAGLRLGATSVGSGVFFLDLGEEKTASGYLKILVGRPSTVSSSSTLQQYNV